MATTVDQAVADTYLFATGKATPPVFGATKYTKILALFNHFSKTWSKEADTDWASLRTIATGPVITATDTFLIPTSLGKVSGQEGDFVRIKHLDGVSESEYTNIPADRLYNDGSTINNWSRQFMNANGAVAVVGANIVFSRAFLTTDPQFGGTLYVPGYTIPPTLVNASDLITVDDPNWLSLRAAAEYVRTDLTRVAQYPNLIALANEAMEAMKAANSSQSEDVYRGSYRPLGSTWR